MDYTAASAYRGLALNDAERLAPGGVAVGISIDNAVFGDVQGVGYTEKRARNDGMDGSDVYLGGRRIFLTGKVYGTSRADLTDRWDELVATFTPTLAYAEDSGERGYLPWTFVKETANTAAEPAGFPDGVVPCFVNVRPLATPRADWNRDRSSFIMPWQVALEAIDPRIYVNDIIEVSLAGATSGSGTLRHRGTYPSPVSILLLADTGDDQTFSFLGAGSDLTLAIPEFTDAPCSVLLNAGSPSNEVVIVDHAGQELLRMDVLDFTTDRLLPYVQPGSSAYSWSVDGGQNLLTGSKLTYYEAFI